MAWHMPVRKPITAVVPMKPLAESKMRLSSHLSEDERAELSAAMLASVLSALRDSEVSATIVVGGDDRVQSIAAESESDWKPDEFKDLNLAVGEAFGSVWESGCIPAYIPADLPLLTVSDLNDMTVFASNANAITICPAHDGGTNGLIVPSCNGFSPRLGEQSYKRHREVGAELGSEVREFWSPGFVLDVDTIENLHACLDSLPSHIQNYVRNSGGDSE